MKLRRSGLHWACLFALGAVALVGCQEVVHTVELTVTATEAPSLEDLWEGPQLAGVELCQTDTTNCAVTDSVGFAQITLPANQEISYTLKKEGYVSYLVGDVSDETVEGTTWPMASVELATLAADLLEIAYPWTGGAVALSLPTSSPRAGVTYDIMNGTATAYYFDEAGTPTLDLTATTSNGHGGFVEVSPGEPQFEFGGTATNCVPSVAWPGDAPNRIRVPVRVGYQSYGSMNCDTL